MWQNIPKSRGKHLKHHGKISKHVWENILKVTRKQKYGEPYVYGPMGLMGPLGDMKPMGQIDPWAQWAHGPEVFCWFEIWLL